MIIKRNNNILESYIPVDRYIDPNETYPVYIIHAWYNLA
jgi:hypothetical protein